MNESEPLTKASKGLFFTKTNSRMCIGISLEETCLLTKRWTVHRWHELNIGIYTKRGNLRTNVKGEYQAEEPQDKSTNVVIGAD